MKKLAYCVLALTIGCGYDGYKDKDAEITTNAKVLQKIGYENSRHNHFDKFLMEDVNNDGTLEYVLLFGVPSGSMETNKYEIVVLKNELPQKTKSLEEEVTKK